MLTNLPEFLAQYPPHTVANVISSNTRIIVSKLEAPLYDPSSLSYRLNNPLLPDLISPSNVGLAVESMCHHMSDEGWQIFKGLGDSGYCLQGYNLPYGRLHVPQIILDLKPTTLLLQDKREWDTRPGDFREPRAKFTGIESLVNHPEIFKLTIVKDAQQRPLYHRKSAEEMGCHAWVIYYHPSIVCHLAPYVRRLHIVRTYHTIDADIVPGFSQRKSYGCILSGATGPAYPLRNHLMDHYRELPRTIYLRHPGYHRSGCNTPSFLKTLSQFKVAICTASKYGYALRKIIEATACGCRVITDLPIDEQLPEIDSNLIRVHPSITIPHMSSLIDHAIDTYNPVFQESMSNCARIYYDYRTMTRRLANHIEMLRQSYNKS